MNAAPALRLVRDDSDGKLPPFSDEAQAAVIAAVLIDPKALPKIPFLRPEHFYGESHRRMFEGAKAIQTEGKPVDLVTVATWLKDRGRLEQVGGLMEMTLLVAQAPAITNVRDYAIKVLDHWRVRQTIVLCQRVAAQGYLDHGDPQAFIDDAARALISVSRMGAVSPVERNIDLLKRTVREIAAEANAPTLETSGIPTGIRRYDELTGGLHAGSKTVIAALPGRGKSTIALQIAVNVASRGIGVLLFSQEMTKKQLAERQLAMLASVDSKRIQSRHLSMDEWRRIHAIPALQTALPIVIDDTAKIDMHQVRAAAMAQVDMMPIVEGVPLGLIIVDYVQRLESMPDHARKQKYEQIYESSKAFKNLCRELEIPGIELAQQKKDDPRDPGAKPTMTDFAGCRDLANEADQVVYLHRLDAERTRLLLLKQRDGACGEATLRMRGEFCRFDEAEDDDWNERSFIPESRQWLDTKRASAGDRE